ncbi:hypothetical protein C2G38_2210589 [Gigaspora rosea]|uniref:Uncharacterized protein n=1 Tax=Gigaspora rosea TaxID=44941 RepID=A0A397UF81_9GLOM|nr:hypothetical protein C2G38_2210589 [Gigaspora rosea]
MTTLWLTRGSPINDLIPYIAGLGPEVEEKNYCRRYFVPFGIEGEKSSYAKDGDLAKFYLKLL